MGTGFGFSSSTGFESFVGSSFLDLSDAGGFDSGAMAGEGGEGRRGVKRGGKGDVGEVRLWLADDELARGSKPTQPPTTSQTNRPEANTCR